MAYTESEVALAVAAKTSSDDGVCCTYNQRAASASGASGHAKYTIYQQILSWHWNHLHR